MFRRSLTLRRYSQSIDGIQEGLTVKGFLLKQKHYIAELDTTVLRLKHEQTGANYVHLHRDDANSVFAIGFKTIPGDSTGVPHILEHTVLCGSKKYPVRDPFFKMLNRSMSNYMNAWTASDHTFYPFATEHQQDHANLRDIYFDAVFDPLLREQDFRQEGWRLCPQTKRLMGVVLNEMKGAMSDAEAIMSEAWQSIVYSGSCYGYNSGGDPLCIPQLSHQQLVDFHNQHYRPGNALFVGYGRLLFDNLEYLSDKLAQYGASPGKCPNVRKINKLPRDEVIIDGPLDPIGDTTKQHRTLMAWRCNDLIKHQETFHWQLLSHLLMDGPTAPLYEALVESGLGSDFTAGTGYHNNAVLTSFGVGLQGCHDKNVKTIHKVIMETLTRCANEGIAKERIESALHQIQLSLKYKSASFGLNLCALVMSGWTRGIYPVDQLSITDKVEEFLRRSARKPVLESLLKKWILSDNDRLVLTMKPDKQYNDKLAVKEQELVETIMKGMSSQDIDNTIKQNDELLSSQQQKVDIDNILPILKVSELSQSLKTPSLKPQPTKDGNHIQVFSKVTPSANGVSYFKVLKKFDRIPPHPELLPLALAMFTEYGPTTFASMEEYEEAVKRSCSGFSINYILKSATDFCMVIGMHCLQDKSEDAIKLLKDTLWKVDYSRSQRLKTHIAGTASNLSNAISSSGHQYAMSAALSMLRGADDDRFKMRDVFGGLVQAELMQSLAGRECLDDIVEKIKDIHSFLMQAPGKVRVSCVSSVEGQEELMIDNIAMSFTGSSKAQNGNTIIDYRNYDDCIEFPMNTKYAAAALSCNPTTVKEKAALILAGELLKSKYLHREIRESGGAYGAGSSFNHLDNVFSFYSYRDPTPERSIEQFKSSVKWLGADGSVSEKDVDEAKLSVISSTDAPKDLGEEGLALFKHDITDDERTELRRYLLSSTIDDIIQAAKVWLNKQDSDWSTCIIKGHDE